MKRFDVVVPRRYEVNGQEKTQRQNIGVAFAKDGKMWGELRLIPTNWNGRFQLFEPKANEQAQQQATAPVSKQTQDNFGLEQDDYLPF